jgi:hypothetical protein
MHIPEEFQGLIESDTCQTAMAELYTRLEALHRTLHQQAEGQEEETTEEIMAWLRWGIQQEALDDDGRLLAIDALNDTTDPEELEWHVEVRQHVRSTYPAIIAQLRDLMSTFVTHPAMREPALIATRAIAIDHEEAFADANIDAGMHATIFLRSFVFGSWVSSEGATLQVVTKRGREIYDTTLPREEDSLR